MMMDAASSMNVAVNVLAMDPAIQRLMENHTLSMRVALTTWSKKLFLNIT